MRLRMVARVMHPTEMAVAADVESTTVYFIISNASPSAPSTMTVLSSLSHYFQPLMTWYI